MYWECIPMYYMHCHVLPYITMYSHVLKYLPQIKGGNPLVRIPAVTVLDTVILYGMNCTKRFVNIKRYFDYFTTIFTFLQKEGSALGSHSGDGAGVVNWGFAASENLVCNAIQWFWCRKGSLGVFAESQMAAEWLRSLVIRWGNRVN